jgi:hypothetical protein
MAFDIREILTTISKNGVMQTNKFDVRVTPPKILQNLNINEKDTGSIYNTLNFRADSAKLPGVLIQTSDINRYGIGPTQKMPTNAQFTDINLTFIADKNGDIYRFFYVWLNAIFDFGGIRSTSSLPTYKVAYKDYYTSEILQVSIYDNYGKIKQVVSLYKAYPVSFNEVPLDWGSQDQLMKFNIAFTFRDWALESISTALPGGGVTGVVQNVPTATQINQQVP